MTDEQFRQLRTLILDQGAKIEALAIEVRRLKQAVETTEILYAGPDDIGEKIDVPDDLKKFFPD